MCGRFNVTSDPMTELFMDFVGMPYTGGTNYNTGPRQQAWIIREDEESQVEATQAQWWLVPNWVKEASYKYSMFNARSEKAAKSPAFREPFRNKRCIVPITGFYEWINRNGQKQPYMVHSPERNGLLLAGLWDRWIDRESDEALDSFTILTTNVVEDLKFLHHRQPVMLDKNDARTWLDQNTDLREVQGLCRSRIPYDMVVSPVSTYVNNMRNRGEGCTEVVGDQIELKATPN